MDKQKTSNKLDYAKAGVSIDAGNKFVDSISDLTKQTDRIGSLGAIGGFGGLFDIKQLNYKDPLFVSSTDGVGTKLKIAFACNKHDTVGQDLVAMCVNDVVAQGAEPLFFLDYFATGKLEQDQAYQVVAGIVRACKESNCALLGGETAEMPSMYRTGEYDLAGFVVGIVERDNVLPKKDSMQPGYIVIGLQSSGPHSNGFSLIRAALEQEKVTFFDTVPFASPYKTWGELLLQPTHLYSSAVTPLCKQGLLKGVAHITGGGLLENLPRILPDHLGVELDMSSWHVPTIFSWLHHTVGIEIKEMQRTFNLGIGMALIVDPSQQDTVMNQLKNSPFEAYVIGKLTHRNGNDTVTINGDISKL